MSSTPSDVARPSADGRIAAKQRSGWLDPAFGRSVRLAILGLLAATIGAVAAYQVFAPSGGGGGRDATPPVAAPEPAAGRGEAPTAAAPAPLLRFKPLSASEAFLVNAAIPNSPAPDEAARPFTVAGATASDHDLDSTCLTQAVYYEAASESLEGQRAVAQVVLNRVRDGRYPRTVCGVVFQGAELRTGCQFSFTCDGSMRRPLAAAAWKRAHAVAEAALEGFVMTAVGHATHYHTVWVTPYWSPSLIKLGRIGAHIFYRWGIRKETIPPEVESYAGGEALPEPEAAPSTAVAVAAAADAQPFIPPPPSQIRAQVVAPTPTPPPTLPAPVDTPAIVAAPYRAAPRRAPIDSPGFAARDQGR